MGIGEQFELERTGRIEPERRPTYHVKVVWADGTEELLKEGDAYAVFRSLGSAERARDFLVEGLDVEEYQSVNVVKEEP